MIVISDSTPLITLMKAAKLNILQGLFGEVRIPAAVFSELTSNESFREEAELIKCSDFVRVVTVESDERVAFLFPLAFTKTSGKKRAEKNKRKQKDASGGHKLIAKTGDD